MKNIEKLIAVAYIALITGITFESVGKIPTQSLEPYSSMLPLKMFVFLAIPYVLGYFAGKKDAE